METLRFSPRSEAEKIRREFARDMRSGSYMIVFSIVFAFIIQNLAIWVHEINIWKMSPQECVLNSGLILSLFLYSVYFWMFFSRVLIYFQEQGLGELLSFTLAASILGIILFLKDHPRWWPFFLLIPSILVCLKLWVLSLQSSFSARDDFRKRLAGWRNWSLIVSGGLVFIGAFTFPTAGEAAEREWVNVSAMVILLLIGVIGVIKASYPIRVFIEGIVEDSIEKELKEDNVGLERND